MKPIYVSEFATVSHGGAVINPFSFLDDFDRWFGWEAARAFGETFYAYGRVMDGRRYVFRHSTGNNNLPKVPRV